NGWWSLSILTYDSSNLEGCPLFTFIIARTEKGGRTEDITLLRFVTKTVAIVKKTGANEVAWGPLEPESSASANSATIAYEVRVEGWIKKSAYITRNGNGSPFTWWRKNCMNESLLLFRANPQKNP
ncbi:hypothetical protein, partial [Paenibacillus mesotrionivorans]